MSDSVGDHPLFKEALSCLRFGYFSGAIERFKVLEDLSPEHRLACSFAAWLARVYEGGDSRRDAASWNEAFDLVKKLDRGLGVTELALVLAEHGRGPVRRAALKPVFRVLDGQNGVLVSHHPTALLRLSQISIDRHKDLVAARRLVSCGLGWSKVYVSTDDTDLLARLLVKLRAPLPLWADWIEIFIDHLHVSHARASLITEEIPDTKAEHWAAQQEEETVEVFDRVLRTAPVGFAELARRLAPRLDAPALGDVAAESIRSDRPVRETDRIERDWYDVRNLRSRYFWHDMLSAPEQAFIRNGDWALFCCPTEDYSMGLAQWWRVLESVLKRGVVEPLSTLFSQNPGWIHSDQERLSERQRRKNAIFIEKLADDKRAARMTLAEILLVLEKCLSDRDMSDPPSPSKLRSEASKFLDAAQRQVEALMGVGEYRTHHLTQANINWFRNRSSHDEPVDLIDASVGRILARRTISAFYLPVLEQWGFVPYMPIITPEE